MSKKSIDEIVEEKYPTFANMIKDIKSIEELNKTLIIYLREKEQLIITKERDEELNKLKSLKTEAAKPYNQTIAALKKMTSCIYKFGHKFEAELKEEFEKNLVLYARQLSHVKSQKDDDENLNALSEMIKQINEDYNPTITLLELKGEYVSYIIKTRFLGGEDGPKVEI